ncbi:hypothetical protein FF38_08493 [Lucilia cuprina]|uniref:Uncharacterized protein n=1 Tax=Lucilia cuprina TaxID=7375 RepID=A0A0L0CI28_LUCCU|nr:hypothetical protein FF38_08493 [Lucilia cuprina]
MKRADPEHNLERSPAYEITSKLLLLNTLCIHIIIQTASDNAINSVSVDNETALLFSKKIYTELDFLSILHSAQLAIYLATRLTRSFQSPWFRLHVFLGRIATLAQISGRVLTAIYNNDPSNL